MINLHEHDERMLPISAGVEPATSWSPVGRRIRATEAGPNASLPALSSTSLPALSSISELLIISSKLIGFVSMPVCFIRALRRFQQSFSHIAMVSGSSMLTFRVDALSTEPFLHVCMIAISHQIFNSARHLRHTEAAPDKSGLIYP